MAGAGSCTGGSVETSCAVLYKMIVKGLNRRLKGGGHLVISY